MSFKAMAWAASVKTQTPTQKLILLLLADRAGDCNTCFPSLNRIAEDACMSKSGVIENIKKLSALGFIGVKKRQILGDDQKGYKSNLYLINVGAHPLGFTAKEKVVNHMDSLVNEVDKGSQPDGQGVVNEVDTNLSVEPINEPYSVEANASPESSNQSKEPKAQKDTASSKRKIFTPPTIAEVQSWAEKWGMKHGKSLVSVDSVAVEAFNYYSRLDWHDSKGQKIKNWKMKIAAVWFTDDKLKPQQSGPNIPTF